jgi:chromosome segregation ATPase
MVIASVVQGLIETEDGKVFELDSCKGSAWLESIGSFRYEPTGANKPYTVRQETKKGGDYWYGYRKVAGKLHKKYIGKSSELSMAKLEEIAEALNTPQPPRVTQVTDIVTQVTEANNQQVTDIVTQVTEANNQQVTDTVTDRDTVERVTALELQFQALQESLEELRSVLLGKSEGLSNSSELLNPDRVTDRELQKDLSNLSSKLQDENQRLLIELGNLTAENQKVRADYAALLESSTHITNKLRQELQELRSQLETEKTRGEEIWEELSDTEQALVEVRSENSELKKTCAELRSQLEQERADREKLRKEFDELNERHLARVFVAEALQNEKSATASELPEAADLLNQLKAKRKKSKTDLADLEVILEILES